MERNGAGVFRLLAVLAAAAWCIQAFVLPALPRGVWPNVAELSLFGLPTFFVVHMVLSLVIVAGFFAYVKICRF